MQMINNKSNQYLFKNKLNARFKSKRELIKESFFMLIIGFCLLLVNYFIPEKLLLFNSFKKNIFNITENIFQIIYYSIDIIIVLFICFTLLMSIILIIGSINRITKVFKRKSRKIRIR